MAEAAAVLVPASEADVLRLMPWFADQRSCAIWGGPQFRYPFTAETFLADIHLRELPSYVLRDADEAVCAFGQCYLRVGRCHLGRLVVSPLRRGRGLGTALILGLAREGVRRFGVPECSLFVAPDNEGALRLYDRLGFRPAVYPEDDPMVRPFVYMVAPAGR